MKTVAYLRVSTAGQDLANQRLAILDYARKKRPQSTLSLRPPSPRDDAHKKNRSSKPWSQLRKGDRLIVSELSRLGRSLGQIIQIVDHLVKQGVHLIALKESLQFQGKQDMQSKVMVTLFGLFAEIERDLISERTKEGLAAARAKGRMLGRPRGVLGKSKLDGKEAEIRLLLEKTVSKASIAKIMDISPPTMHHFIRTRRLQPKQGLRKAKA